MPHGGHGDCASGSARDVYASGSARWLDLKAGRRQASRQQAPRPGAAEDPGETPGTMDLHRERRFPHCKKRAGWRTIRSSEVDTLSVPVAWKFSVKQFRHFRRVSAVTYTPSHWTAPHPRSAPRVCCEFRIYSLLPVFPTGESARRGRRTSLAKPPQVTRGSPHSQ